MSDYINPVIYYDESKNLYNFPYILEFNSNVETIDFYFHEQDYSSEEEMLQDRNKIISEKILNDYILNQFQCLQEICLLEKEDFDDLDKIAIEITERLTIICNLFLVLKMIKNLEILKKMETIHSEIVEMFILLEDYYIGIRKPDFIQIKEKIKKIDK